MTRLHVSNAGLPASLLAIESADSALPQQSTTVARRNDGDPAFVRLKPLHPFALTRSSMGVIEPTGVSDSRCMPVGARTSSTAAPKLPIASGGRFRE